MPLSRHSVGTYPEMSLHATCQGTLDQSSQLTESLWTDPSLKGGISVHTTLHCKNKKGEKKQKQGMNG